MKSWLALLVLVTVASISMAGCTVNVPISSPSSTTTAAPTTTPDYTQDLEGLVAGWGWSIPDLKRVSDNTYFGTCNTQPTAQLKGRVSTYTFQTFDSEEAAKERFEQVINEKMREGFKGDKNYGTLVPWITAKENWTGERLPQNCLLMYVYDNNIQRWIVTTKIDTYFGEVVTTV